MGRARRWIVLALAAAVAVAVAAVLVTSAGARPASRAAGRSGPIAHVAFPPSGGSESVNDTIPAGGSGQISTDTLPAGLTQGQVDIRPQQSGQADYEKLTAFLAPQKLSGRLLSCIALTLGALKSLTGGKKGINVAFTDEDSALPYLFLIMCVNMAYDIGFGSTPPVADVASTGCARVPFSAPVTISRVGGKWVGKVAGTVSSSRRSLVAVTCKRKGRDLLIAVKPAKRGQTLRQSLGSNLAVEVVNPTKRSLPIHVTFTAH